MKCFPISAVGFVFLSLPVAAQTFTCAFDTICDPDGACTTAEPSQVLAIGINRETATLRIGAETFAEVALDGTPPDATAFGRPDTETHAGVFRFVDIADTAILLIEGDALGLGYAAMSGTCGVNR